MQEIVSKWRQLIEHLIAALQWTLEERSIHLHWLVEGQWGPCPAPRQGVCLLLGDSSRGLNAQTINQRGE